MKRLKAMHTKMQNRYMLLFVVLFIVLIILVNLTVRAFVKQNAKNELESSFDTIRVVLRERLLSETPSEKVMDNLRVALKIIRNSEDIYLLIYDVNHRLIYPPQSESMPFDKNDLEQLSRFAIPENEGKLVENTFSKSRYLVATYPLPAQSKGAGKRHVVLAASMASNDALLNRLNLTMTLIVFGGLTISFVMSRQLAKEFSVPIEHAATHASAIEKGDYGLIQDEPNTLEVKILYDALNQMSRSLEKNALEQMQFLQNLSHDLRTPLMSIRGYAEGIQKEVFKEPSGAADIIASESEKLTTLVEQLLTFSRVESEAIKVSKKRCSIGDLLDPIFNRYQILANTSGKKIVFEGALDDWVETDEELWDTIVSNLLSNALRYCKDTVQVKWSEDKAITIEDDGDGISKDVYANLFKRFNKGKQGHIGLGLSIVMSAVNRLQAQIEVDSNPSGTRFTVKF